MLCGHRPWRRSPLVPLRRASSPDGATGSLFDGTRAPSTVGSWLRAHKWSNVRQLDAISRELLARLWTAGADPTDRPPH